MSSSTSSSSTPKIPKSVIIVGSGAFGLSTAWALCRNPDFTYTSITVVDRQTFPTPDGSSVSCFSCSFGHLCQHAYAIGKRNPSQIGSNFLEHNADHTTSRLTLPASSAPTTLLHPTIALRTLRKIAGAPTLRPRSTTSPVSP